MWLRNIHLINFQAHEELHVDFCKDVNVIFGDSEKGKTCIKHAIEFLCMHETFNGQRRVGTKTTSVKGEFDNGVIVERIVSNSINRYILTKDGKEQPPLNSVGKTAPDEIKEAIGIYPITVDGEDIYLNSASQVGLPFLMDKSPSFRMKLFNKLTGNDVLDKLFKQFNVDILRIKRGYREETETFEQRAKDLKIKQIEKEKAETQHVRLKKRVLNVHNLYEKYSKLLELKTLEEKSKRDLKETKIKLKNLKVPQAVDVKQLKEKIDRYEEIKTVKNGCERLQAGLDKVSVQLKAIRIPDVDIAALNSKIKRFDTVKTAKENLDTANKKCYTIEEDLKELELALSDKKKEYKNLLKEAKICPLCQSECDEEHIRKIKL